MRRGEKLKRCVTTTCCNVVGVVGRRGGASCEISSAMKGREELGLGGGAGRFADDCHLCSWWSLCGESLMWRNKRGG